MDNAETNQNQDAVESPSTEVPAPVNEVEVPAALREVDPAKLAAMRAKLAAFIAGKNEPSPPVTEEAIAAQQEAEEELLRNTDPNAPTGTPAGVFGRNVDWTEYDVPFQLRHLYPQSEWRETSQGPAWVVILDDFFSTTKRALAHGERVNQPGTKDKEQTEPKNLGEYLTAMINGPDGWKIAAILPANSGDATILLQRKVPYAMPMPPRLRTAVDTLNEVGVPTDEELARAEAAGLEFAAELGLEAPAPVEAEAAELEVEKVGVKYNEIPEEMRGAQERVNLDLNRRFDIEAPAGVQPDAVILDERTSTSKMVIDENGNRVAVDAPSVDAIRKGLRDILSGPDFGTLRHPGQ